MNFLNDYIPYGAQEAQYEREMEAAAYEEAVLAQQGNDANEILGTLPNEMERIFSPEIMKLLGPVLQHKSESIDQVWYLMYDLCLMKVQMEA
ncbi:hypothetical protein [Xenorhabdus hominickii]|uniref:Uncharacterized protein n=1 Tax=Xenorhabdus hominickii TaxID=351679 RepID=A0A2G0Q5T5_XENHO|nr:hypothetical protein [Xenorhabdus hominickii]AOM39639.1 hypothetical protein A9255_02940 [Xenorhabdus hominickii]PHM54576.1 hypothetical protein Xhom_02519 [Xenorhabdus hominickii]